VGWHRTGWGSRERRAVPGFTGELIRHRDRRRRWRDEDLGHGLDPAAKCLVRYEAIPDKRKPAAPGLSISPEGLDRMITSIAAWQERHSDQSIPRDVSGDRGLLDRDELLKLLDQAVNKRVTVISAPPGSGKTSLLRAWAGHSTNIARVAFVSVDRNEQDAQRFWSGVLDAIRSATPSIDPQTQSGPTAALDGDELVDTVVSELAGRVEPVVLIIDDLHELRSADAMAQLERLLAVLPRSSAVVLSTRRDPSISLHWFRLAGDMAEIRASDLQFSERETRELLAASGIGLSAGGAAALHRRTEGWAAGLRLAVISLSGHADPEGFVAEFSGTHRAIGEYLMAEMLECQPSEVQSVLLRTSLVDRVNGELADLLSGRLGSERMLLNLEDANAFVVSLDAHRTWFRYHHLVSDFLRLELRRRFADEVPDLHRRAARWFADHGEIVEAVRHAGAAADWHDAARLVADQSFRWVLDGQAGTISAVLRSFPKGASADHPDLALAHAANELNQGRLEEAAAQLTLAESDAQAASPARRRRLGVAISSLRLALARSSGQFSEVIEQVNLLDASLADASNARVAIDSELRGVALLNLGIVETWSGGLADAERHLLEGAELARTIGWPFLEVACRAHLGFPSRTVSVAAARERGHQTVTLAERHGFGDHPILATALGALAGAAIWTGEFDEGERWLRRAWEVAEARTDPAGAMHLHALTGMLHAGGGRHQAALQAFTAAAHAESLLIGLHAALAPRIAGWLAGTQARLGMLDEARASLSGFSTEPERMGAIYNARAVICLAEGDPARALEVLRDVRDATRPIVPGPTLVEAHLLAGTAHLSLGERTAAAAAAEAALASAEPDRLLFPFAIIGAGELLTALPLHETAHGALLTDVLDLLKGEPAPSHDREHLSLTEEFSPSELRVLRYLPTNLTRRDIARELHLSVNTVNTHVRNIYSKLGARNRSSAVQHARELRLLSTGRR
jgi:LuxR family transcriptional regulator, maltose regulon positive regulatory protein